MAESPPLNRFYVLGYAANDKDFPIISANLDPRVAGYKVPEDLSVCPDKRYPNHVFTGAQPLSGDERVRHVWEILPSPWVPFTRYDDDLGPIQGRRRSVANTGQEASLASDKKISYEGREGSAIVSTEIEETWSIKTDEDGNSLFPIKDRDFYDPSKGPVQERRQLFVPTGEEAGSLENINGVITQTSYEAYNEFLSIKIVQTYSVDGPQLIGKATDNEGQLVTVTTQRKGALNYVPPNPTATRTVEASREDAESLVERIVDTPEVFSSRLIGKEAVDPAPAKFRVAAPTTTEEQTVEGTVAEPTLEDGDISKSEQQVNKFIKRIRSTFRNLLNLPKSLTQKETDNQGQLVTVTETLQLGDTSDQPTATKTIASEALGDGTYVVRKSEIENIFTNKSVSASKTDLTPEKFKAKQQEKTTQENVIGDVPDSLILLDNEFSKSEEQVTKFVKRVSSTTRDTETTNSLSEFVITPDGQVASRVLTLSKEPQSIEGGATVVDGSIEALGDGRTIKTLTTVDLLLPKKVFSAQKPDIIPERFRATIPTTTKSSIVEGEPSPPLLEAEDLEVSQQSLGAHTYRDSKTQREDGPYEELYGLDYDEQFNVGIPYTESIGSGTPSGKNKEASPIGDDKHILREYKTSDIELELGAFYESYPTTINLDLPRILKGININYEQDVSSGVGVIYPEELNGAFTSITQSLQGKASGSITLSPKVAVEFETIWGKNLKATNHVFFLKGPITEATILAKCGASETWPVFKPISKTFQLIGVRRASSVSAGVTRSQQLSNEVSGFKQQKTDDEDTLRDLEITTVEIPPCLTPVRTLKDRIPINYPIEAWASLPALTGPSGEIVLPEIESRKSITMQETLVYNITIPASTPTDVPRSGIYLMDSNVQFFKYGFFLVTATTFDASQIA